MMKWLMLPLLLVSHLATAGVGSVTEFQGTPAQALRAQETLTVELGFDVAMMDKLITANSRMAIVFEDATRVELTEQSQLVIDDFVYDPNTGAGQMAMNVVMGTVQMTSGRMARNSRDNVNIRTPTATIAIRGTDFSMTVDEIGRSLIVLLPSCEIPTVDEEDCPVGSIEVSTQAGSVVLDQPYESTLVSDGAGLPSNPRRLLLGRADINNMLIITPPQEFPYGFNGFEQEEYSNGLSEDLLAAESLDDAGLGEDLLDDSQLDQDRLAANFLDSAFGSDQLRDELEIGEGVLPNVSSFGWVFSRHDELNIFVSSERPPHIAEIQTDVATEGRIRIVQDGIEADIQMNSGGTDVVINITQNQ